MLYHLFDWFRQNGIKVPGGALFQFITFRVLLAVLFALIISMLFGKRMINILLRKQVGESVRELGLAGEQQKKGTPTMGGFIIILAILAPIMATVIQLAISRQREFMADAGSVELTRNPDGLINALRKLGSDNHDLRTANRGTAHLFIVNPFHVSQGLLDWDSAFSTHPPLNERIARLEAMKR